MRPVAKLDLDEIVELQAGYYREDGYPFSKADARRTWGELLEHEDYARAWVFEAEGSIVGYCVLTLGFSLEYRGRDAFVDEIYIAPEWRGQGLGRRALELIEKTARALGVRALHLEVETEKAGARGLYESVGFRGNHRALLTKRLDDGG